MRRSALLLPLMFSLIGAGSELSVVLPSLHVWRARAEVERWHGVGRHGDCSFRGLMVGRRVAHVLRIRGGFKAKWGEKYMPGLGKKRVSIISKVGADRIDQSRSPHTPVWLPSSFRKGYLQLRRGTTKKTSSSICWNTNRSFHRVTPARMSVCACVAARADERHSLSWAEPWHQEMDSSSIHNDLAALTCECYSFHAVGEQGTRNASSDSLRCARP
jgi:hypothetical protein